MINPKTNSEQLLFTTVRLETDKWSWTWFFFHLKIDNKIYPIIITNKHVVNYKTNEKVKFHLHEKIANKPEWNIEIEYTADWLFHPEDSVDLCCCLVQTLFHDIKTSLGKDVFYKNVDESFIENNQRLEELNAIEDIVMVWYPNGLWDQKHNLPLFRKGITASHPWIDFNGKSEWVVDMACFPGSSWSPIFISNEGTSYMDKSGTINFDNRIMFLGILFAWPVMNSKWELIVENIPTSQTVISQTPIMINLGYYIKAVKILDLGRVIKKYYSL